MTGLLSLLNTTDINYTKQADNGIAVADLGAVKNRQSAIAPLAGIASSPMIAA